MTESRQWLALVTEEYGEGSPEWIEARRTVLMETAEAAKAAIAAEKEAARQARLQSLREGGERARAAAKDYERARRKARAYRTAKTKRIGDMKVTQAFYDEYMAEARANAH